ncbi:MAG TPA: amidohydrolase [Flavisolibacter sp.]|jgi:hypothetical protein|nr:amidohydrolase [Flavisolibacter sp.]
MKQRFLFLVLIPCVLLSQAWSQAPDLIVLHGKIFTSDKKMPYVEALAIRDGRILAVGTSDRMEKLVGPGTRTIDLQGKTVIPGINDAHDHIGSGAAVGYRINFRSSILPGPSFKEVLDSVRLLAGQLPSGTVLQGALGMQILEDPLARREALDKVAPDHPVILQAPWGHSMLFNTKALQMIGISDTASDPVGGTYERYQGSSWLTGLLQEYGQNTALRKWYSGLPQEILVQVFRNYSYNALQMGITSVQNMGTDLELDKLVAVVQQADIPVHMRLIRFPGSGVNGRELSASSGPFPVTPTLEVSGYKYILDGTPIERGALMLQEYGDQPGWKGRLNFPLDTLRRIVREGFQSREQLLLHITGDATAGIVLKEMLNIADAPSWVNKRVRFEHADGLLPEHLAMAHKMGIVVVQNPTHFSFDQVLRQRLGTERLAYYEPLFSLLEAGIPLALGSDGPENPFLNIMFAAMHPVNPKEAITREEAVTAYTYGAAYAENKELEKGQLKEGMQADLVVLSQDIFTIPLQALPGTVSDMTIIRGKIVYERRKPY